MKKVTKKVTMNTPLMLSPVGDTSAIHAKLDKATKRKVDDLAKQLNVHQWVVINNLCTKGLESLGL